MDILTLVVQLVSGAVGGNIAGSVLKKLSLGPVRNSVVGIVGGGLGALLLALGFGAGSGGIDAASVVGSMAGGAAGGGGLLAIIGGIRNAMGRSA